MLLPDTQALSVFQGKRMQLVSGLVESPQGKHGMEGAESRGRVAAVKKCPVTGTAP